MAGHKAWGKKNRKTPQVEEVAELPHIEFKINELIEIGEVKTPSKKKKVNKMKNKIIRGD